jgi:hypothetical protein
MPQRGELLGDPFGRTSAHSSIILE